MCTFIQFSKFIIIIEAYATVMILTIGFCLAVADFVSDLEENLRQLNEDLIGLEDKELTANEHIKLTKKLSEIIEFNIEARE